MNQFKGRLGMRMEDAWIKTPTENKITYIYGEVYQTLYKQQGSPIYKAPG